MSTTLAMSAKLAAEFTQALATSSVYLIIFADNKDAALIAGADFYLGDDGNGLAVVDLRHTQQKGVFSDFTSAAYQRRFTQGRVAHELLIKAVGKHQRPATVVDATFGLGRDGFLLAAAGFNVLAFERAPVAYCIARNGLQRASVDASTAVITQRIELRHADFIMSDDNTPTLQAAVVYLDPMYPERKKSALVKKEMRVFRELMGEDGDAEQLLQYAKRVAQKRVVVKRPLKGNTLTSEKPSFSLTGRSCRFDVYL
jgi:16S rRNA (guanine1516-N2)-methyltransferase